MDDVTTAIDLEAQLNAFNPSARRAALSELASHPTFEARADTPRGGMNVNMHLHSFFSYNACGHSPSRLAWEASKTGLYAAGLCDFDVLDGLAEFLEAGRVLGLRGTVSLETRAYLKEYSDVDISSPGEPGVTYVMGAGFARDLPAGSAAARGLKGYRDRARERNVALVRRINPHLPPIAIDYERDVLPLTPSGSATERHIVTAYINKSKTCFDGPRELAEFWSEKLSADFEETVALLGDPPRFEEVVRAKLAKRGGSGYEAPSVGTFPPVDEFMPWVASCEAIPMIAWLDGTSAGEKDGHALLECMMAKGGAALNIIPDRNWNVSDDALRAVKRANLAAIVEEADRLGLTMNVGTEMNKLGLPFVDDLDGEALRPYKGSFLRGARIIVGHTALLRYAGYSYVGEKAAAEFGDVRSRNAFFEAVGGLPPLDVDRAARLEDMGEEKALAWFHDEVMRSGS